MPIKLIAVIILAILVALFTGKNWENTCAVWPFTSLGEIQVSVTIIASFVLGVLVTLPFTLKLPKKKAQKEQKTEIQVEPSPAKKKRSFFAKKRPPLLAAEDSATAEQKESSSSNEL